MSLKKSLLAAMAMAVVSTGAAFAANQTEIKTDSATSTTTKPAIAEAAEKQTLEQKQECKIDKNGVEKCKEKSHGRSIDKTPNLPQSSQNTSSPDATAAPGQSVMPR